MARNFIRRSLERTEQYEREAQPSCRHPLAQSKKSPREARLVFGQKQLEYRPLVFDDTDVCRLLGVRRRVLVAARKKKTRGVDWDCVGQHAGMTEAWIRARGGDPSGLRPIEPGDGIVTVCACSRVANINVIVCFRVASGERAIVMVHDSRLIRIGDQFDCRNAGTKLYRDNALNPEVY